MQTSERIILKVGEWKEGLEPPLKDTLKTGHEVARLTTYHGHNVSGDNEGTYWRLYELDDARYLLWWDNWEAYGECQHFADYTILEGLPLPGVRYSAMRYWLDKRFRSRPVPVKLIDKAEAALGRRLVECLDDKGGIQFENGYRTCYIQVCAWNAMDRYSQIISFEGRPVSYFEFKLPARRASDDRWVKFELYQRSDGRYLMWWKQKAYDHREGSLADYIILKDLPEAGGRYRGRTFGLPFLPVPIELLEHIHITGPARKKAKTRKITLGMVNLNLCSRLVDLAKEAAALKANGDPTREVEAERAAVWDEIAASAGLDPDDDFHINALTGEIYILREEEI